MFGFRSSQSQRRAAHTRGAAAEESPSQLSMTLELSPAMVIASVIGLAVILAWVFVFGVIIGRGYNPETRMPGASLLPQSETARAEDEIIKPEELNFMAELKSPVARSPFAPKKTEAVQKPAAAAPTAAAAQKTPSAAEKNVPTRPAEPVYDYVYQVVAYKKASLAEETRARLAADGVRVQVVVGRDAEGHPRWYRLQVPLRGTAADDAALRERLARSGMKDPLLLSRKAVEQGKKPR